MAVEFGRSGTIYDAAPVHPITFKSGDPDLSEQLGGGFQAAHVWINNPTNQYLWLPDANDLVPPGVSGRVVACQHTDVGRASWSIPPVLGIVQPPVRRPGAATLIFMNAGIDITPHPGVAVHLALLENAIINPTAIVTAISAVGQSVIKGIPDTTPFLVGGIVCLFRNAGARGYPVEASVVKAVDPVAGTITVADSLSIALQVGDIVQVLPPVTVIGGVRPRSWDFGTFANPGAGLRPVITIAGNAGQKIVVAHATGTVVSTVAAADGANFEIVDNGTQVRYESATGTEAVVGSSDRVTWPSLGIANANAGQSMVTQFHTAPQNANNVYTVAVGGYLTVDEPTS